MPMLYKQECQIELQHKYKAILIVAPRAYFQALGLLCTAYENQGIDISHLAYEETLPEQDDWLKETNDKDAVLLIAPFRRAPRTLTDGPLVKRGDGKQIPVGIVTPKTPAELSVFAKAAAALHQQKKEVASLALLSQRHPRYLRLSTRIENILKEKSKDMTVFNWSSDIVFRKDMLHGMGAGIGVALYLGHGRPVGWSGYAGLRAHHFDDKIKTPIGALLSLCCLTASRRKVGRSFSESLVLEGRTASCLAAVIATLHTDNTRWAVRIVQAMSDGVETMGDLISSILPMKASALNAYRIIGDPLAPLLAPKNGVQFAKKIKTYA